MTCSDDAKKPKPVAVIFFWNGNTAVFDQFDQQMGKYQRGDHHETIRLLEEDGVDWRQLDLTGEPTI